MDVAETNRITLHLFLGMPLSAEWKMHLNLSPAWKQMQIAPQNEDNLHLIAERNKEYLAYNLSSAPHTLSELQDAQDMFRKKLSLICPKQDTTKIPLAFFAQLFIA